MIHNTIKIINRNKILLSKCLMKVNKLLVEEELIIINKFNLPNLLRLKIYIKINRNMVNI